MKTNEHSIEEEATWLLEYEVPELKEIIFGVIFGNNFTDNASQNDVILGAYDESEEENGTFSLDD